MKGTTFIYYPKKLKNIKTVINKIGKIDSTFRVFQFELIAGIPQFVTTVVNNFFEV